MALIMCASVLVVAIPMSVSNLMKAGEAKEAKAEKKEVKKEAAPKKEVKEAKPKKVAAKK